MSLFKKRIVSILMLSVFCLYITPKELIHGFLHHIDTTHEVVHSKDGLQISNEHHHCELLKLDQQFAAFNIQVPYYNFKSRQPYYTVSFRLAKGQLLHCNIYSCKQLRAPPVFVV